MNQPFQHSPARRRFIRGTGLIAGGGLLGLSGCDRRSSTGQGRKPFAGRTIRVFTYSGTKEKGLREVFVPLFEERTGAKVVVDPGWWDSIPKLKASPPGQPAFDLVLTDATQGYPAIREGMFQKLDMSRIPNHKNIVAAALDNWVVKDGYGVTFPDSPLVVGYNKKLISTVPADWGDLMREEFRGKLGFYNSFYVTLFTFAAMKAATENAAGTAAELIARDLRGVLDFAKANRDRVKLWWTTTTDMAQNLTGGNCPLGNMHGTDMRVAMRNSADLGATVPALDRASTQLMWVIPENTKETDLAHEAINMIFSEEVQFGFACMGLSTALPKVAAQVASEDREWRAIFPHTAEQLAAVRYYPYDTYAQNWDEIVKIWDREILRKSA